MYNDTTVEIHSYNKSTINTSCAQVLLGIVYRLVLYYQHNSSYFISGNSSLVMIDVY